MSKKNNKNAPAPMPEAENIDIVKLYEDFQNGEIDMITVLGPTASGKTKFAVALAKKFKDLGTEAEIISADSRQVYKGMDIGTGKDLEEYGDVKYHLIDIVEAGTKYNLFEYQQAFEKAYKQICEEKKIPILCGGTGLYIKAATCGYSLPEVPPDPELRASLEQEDIEDLKEKLAELRPIDENVMQSKKRVIRALEVAFYENETGKRVNRTAFLPKKTFFIGTLVSREERNRRIDARLENRLNHGMVEEVQGLLDSGISPEDLMYYGLEYKFLTQYILRVISKNDMIELLKTAIHRFGKRQMTWFRGMEKDGFKIHWINI